MSGRSSKGRIIVVIIVILVLAALACAGYFVLHKKQAGSEAAAVMTQMQQMIPGLGESDGSSGGLGRDPLAALNIEGIDVVGCLEIPALDLMVPVTDKGGERSSFATWKSGSPVKGHFRITGNQSDVFLKLSKLNPGETIAFTDIDGVRYQYQVTTQLNLKNWDKADYDLILGYDIDSDTQFIVGCTAM